MNIIRRKKRQNKENHSNVTDNNFAHRFFFQLLFCVLIGKIQVNNIKEISFELYVVAIVWWEKKNNDSQIKHRNSYFVEEDEMDKPNKRPYLFCFRYSFRFIYFLLYPNKFGFCSVSGPFPVAVCTMGILLNTFWLFFSLFNERRKNKNGNVMSPIRPIQFKRRKKNRRRRKVYVSSVEFAIQHNFIDFVHHLEWWRQ